MSKCLAALNVNGEHIACDLEWPHDGLAHQGVGHLDNEAGSGMGIRIGSIWCSHEDTLRANELREGIVNENHWQHRCCIHCAPQAHAPHTGLTCAL